MREKSGRFRKCINGHIFTCAVIFTLIIIGPVLIAVDLTFLSDWINSISVGDFYTYLAFIGIVSLISIFGFIATLMRSVRGVRVYMIGLSIVTVIHLIVGFVHIMLLFITYQPILMDSCLQRQPHRFFWWSLGYEDSEEMKQIYSTCSKQWYNFAIERLVSWVLYTMISFFSLYVVVKYQQRIVRHRNKVQGEMTNDDEWSDGESYSDLMEKKHHSAPQVMTYHDEEFPPSGDQELSATMYQQRQKLFDEIAKRKRARKNLNRKSLNTNSNRNSTIVVHPLDLSQDPEVYQPPPMPSSEEHDSWNRYEDPTLNEDQEALDRQRRVDALSAERLEYEMYRNEPSSSSTSSLHDLSEVVQRDASRRKRPKSARWSVSYSDTSNSGNTLRRLSSTHEDDEEPHERHEGNQYEQHEGNNQYEQHEGNNEYQDPQYEHHEENQHNFPEEEDNYDDVAHEALLPEDEEESSATNSLLKPASQEKL